MEIDTRVYFSIENPDRTLQINVMPVISSISSILNFILFYLIFQKSEKESKSYKSVLFLHNISLYLSQLYWGSVINMVFLLPFPAVYSIGPLKSVINCFYLTSIWFLLFGWSALMMFWILMVRLRSLARPDSMFFIGQKRYYTMLLVMLLYVILPIFCSWIPGYSPEEKTKIYVAKYYPNCNKALDLPGIFVNTSPAAILAVTIVSFGLLTTGGIFYITLCCIIIYEIRQQTSTWSSRKRKYHIKVLHDTVVQNAVKCVFLAVAPAVELWNIFLDPGTDTILLTMVANIIFVAAPIPCTFLMFFQNRSYRKFFVETFGCYFCVSGASSMQDNSKKSGAAVFTIQQKKWL